MMDALILSQRIAAPPQRAYDFAVDPRNLPRWAPGLCKSVAIVDGRCFVDTPDGRVEFAFAPRNDFGVLDHTVTLPSGVALTMPMRVIANGDGSEVMFTLFRREGMSDAQFEQDAALVRADLQALRDILENP